MWVGQPKSDGNIPAWVFYLANEGDIQPMTGVITKCIYETNAQKMLDDHNTSSSAANTSVGEVAANDAWLEA